MGDGVVLCGVHTRPKSKAQCSQQSQLHMQAACCRHLVEAMDDPGLLRWLFTFQIICSPWFHVMVSTGEEADCPTGDRMTST